MGARLINGDFEADWSELQSHHCLKIGDKNSIQSVEESIIFTPPGWIVWFRYSDGMWGTPEGRVATGTNPARMHSGDKGYMLFTVGKPHDCGLLQKVTCKPGERFRLSAWAHAWSNHLDPEDAQRYPNADDSYWSEGAGHDPFFAIEGEIPKDSVLHNITFWLGIDPNGGTNPYSESVVWGAGAHIYNVYAKVPAVEVTALKDTITIFLRSRAELPFKHNDAYWDDVKLSVISDAERTETSRGQPRIQYERFYVLLPPGADQSWAAAVVEATWDSHRYTFGGSADDAGIGDLDSRIVLAVNPELWGGLDVLSQFFGENYPGVRLRTIKAETPEELRSLLAER